MRCPPEGKRVCFVVNPAGRQLYDQDMPRVGECGKVVSVPVPGGKRTCFPGPGGGLIYVDWDSSRTQGVFRVHLEAETSRKRLGFARRRR